MLWGEQAKLSEQKIQLRFRENYMYTKLSKQAKISNVLLNQYVIFFPAANTEKSASELNM